VIVWPDPIAVDMQYTTCLLNVDNSIKVVFIMLMQSPNSDARRLSKLEYPFRVIPNESVSDKLVKYTIRNDYLTYAHLNIEIKTTKK